MSKELMQADRPGEVNQGFPKGSVGNYKGVMLCNRPNEFGYGGMGATREGPAPFVSRVDPKSPLGWAFNKEKIASKVRKVNAGEALRKHRQYLQTLTNKKFILTLQKEAEEEKELNKTKKVKEIANKQRWKVMEKSPESRRIKKEIIKEYKEPQPALTSGNLKELERGGNPQMAPIIPVQEKKKGKNRPLPLWAMTREQAENMEEQEVDDLLEFAYELDYEKYMEDLQVRQALAVLKNRVKNLKKEEDWKEEFADDWNQEEEKPFSVHSEAQSYRSEKSARSKRSEAQSIQSIVQSVDHPKQWDPTTKTGTQAATIQDKMASKLADEVLKDTNMKNIHSKQSMKKILEQEAKKQLENYAGPKISINNPRGQESDLDPNNLPYLHLGAHI